MEKNAKTDEVHNTTSIGSQTDSFVVPVAKSVIDSELEVDPATDMGCATATAALGRRQSNKRRRVSAKIDLDENVNSNVQLLFGTRTNFDRRCPKGPCPFRDEDTSVAMDTADNHVDPARSDGHLNTHMTVRQSESDKEAVVRTTAAAAEQKTYHCQKCGETFLKKWRLQRHNTEKHRSRSPLKTGPNSRCICPICGKSLSYPLSDHMRMHTGERPYKCATCGKAFFQRSGLRQHLTIHTGVKAHTCADCGKSFRLQGLLQQHLRKHSQQPEKLRHQCHLCGKRFFVPILLRDHLLLHTGERPFQCVVCGRKFRLRTELSKHERLHSGAESSRCNVCGLEKTNMKRHMMIHTGDKPHGCQQCGKAFRRKEHLRAHCLRVHCIELPKREKFEPISIDSCLLTVKNNGVEAVNVDDCGLALVTGDSVVVQ